jgi:hypothetical protein
MGVELIQHPLFYCLKWRSEWTKLRETIADRWSDLAYSLGGWRGRKDGRNGRLVDRPFEKWKPNPKIIKATIQFVMKTGGFQPKITIAEHTGVTEEAGIGVAEEMEESDDESVGRSL